MPIKFSARVGLCLALLGFTSANAVAQATATGGAIGPLWSGASTSRGSAIAFDTRNRVYLAISTRGTLRGRFISQDGVPDTGSGTFIIQSSTNYTHFPAVEYSPDADGGNGAFLVIWQESDQANGGTSVHSRMVSVARGGPFGLDRQLVQASSFFEAPLGLAYASQSRRFLAAWGRQNFSAIGGTLIDNTGAALGSPFEFGAVAGGGVGKPGVAYNPGLDQFLVSFSGWDPNPFVKSIIVSSAGVPNPATETLLGRAAGTYQTDAAYNANSGQYLVAWYQDPGPVTVARLVTAAGAPAGSVTALSTRFAAKDSVDITFNPATGTSLLVAQDYLTVENGGVEISAAGVPGTAAGFTALGGSGNFHPKSAANTGRSEWTMVTSSGFSALYAQRISTTSVSSGGTPAPAPAPCSFTLSSGSESFGPLGGAGGFTLTTGATCTWTMGSNASWLTLGQASLTGTGSKALSYSVAANHSRNARTGILFVGNSSLTVTQSGRTWKVTDVNGDGRSDLLWQNRSTGDLAVWHMNGINKSSDAWLSPARVSDTRWKVAGTLDANRDGHVDLLWQRDDGYVSIWLMAGESQTGTVELAASTASDPRWRIVATGDMDRDGYDDIIWQHKDGTVAVWYMNGTQMRTGEIVTTLADADWRVVGADDFDRDGRLDLLWHHAGSAVISIWRMDDRRLLSGASIGFHVGDLDWQIEGISEMNGDTKPDIIWRNTRTGDLAAWLMDGLVFTDPGTNGVALNPGRVSDLNWKIVGPR